MRIFTVKIPSWKILLSFSVGLLYRTVCSKVGNTAGFAKICPLLPACFTLVREIRQNDARELSPLLCPVQLGCIEQAFHAEIVGHGLDGLPLNFLILVQILPGGFDGGVTQDALDDVQRHLLLHQPGGQGVPEGVGIYVLDLTPLGHGPQTDVKALGVDVGAGGGREQQVVGVGPVRICHGEDMPNQ